MAFTRISDITPGNLPADPQSLLEASVPNGASTTGYETRSYHIIDIIGNRPFDAPADGKSYGRKDSSWIPVLALTGNTLDGGNF